MTCRAFSQAFNSTVTEAVDPAGPEQKEFLDDAYKFNQASSSFLEGSPRSLPAGTRSFRSCKLFWLQSRYVPPSTLRPRSASQHPYAAIGN